MLLRISAYSFRMDARPHRAVQVMQYFRGDGPDEMTTIIATSASGHHDQVGIPGVSGLNYCGRWISRDAY